MNNFLRVKNKNADWYQRLDKNPVKHLWQIFITEIVNGFRKKCFIVNVSQGVTYAFEYAPWKHDINWTYVTRSKDWTSSECRMYVQFTSCDQRASYYLGFFMSAIPLKSVAPCPSSPAAILFNFCEQLSSNGCHGTAIYLIFNICILVSLPCKCTSLCVELGQQRYVVFNKTLFIYFTNVN